MKKRTISKLKSLFGSKKSKRHQQEHASKSSRSQTPDSVGAGSHTSVNGDSFRPIQRTPPSSRAGPPPSPPVPTHPVAPVAPEPPASQRLMPCAVCGRTFVPQSLSKHVTICEKMAAKRRKTFDSFRQRREGTDLEQYLPKNFGLPENSPFLEKSPPTTAKPTPKPKPQTIRNAISKPSADLQRCPHCNRAFGMRAFERHVEWCADKAKILPAAPAQPSQQIANAKQRLNARTQYKAPLARGRRSSQTRDKSSNSRSASVESSREVSPPPPREYGDYKHRRTRASESVSSNDHDEASPHVPVIRNPRNNYPGDVNVKARQARLARDLSSSRKNQEPDPTSSVQQSNTDPNIKKPNLQPKSKNVANSRKQKALKKLEEIATKFNQKASDDAAQLKKSRNSQIPLIKKGQKPGQGTKLETSVNCKPKQEVENKKDSKPKPAPKQQKPKSVKEPSEATVTSNKAAVKKDKVGRSKTKAETAKLAKETSLSLDSLDEQPANLDTDRTCQSIGINTELLCVPCVIHENTEEKNKKKKKKNKLKDSKSSKAEQINTEPQIELLYKNPIIVPKGINEEKVVLFVKEDVSKLDFDNFIVTPSTSGNLNSDETESTTAFRKCIEKNKLDKSKVEDSDSHLGSTNISSENNEINIALVNENTCEVSHSLSEERYEEEYERDVSADISNDSMCLHTNVSNNDNQIECRYGSGETYTKFIEDPADLEEFMNITDKLVSNAEEERDLNIDDIHTPKTNSIEEINNQAETLISEPAKHVFSDTFEELKSNLKELLQCSKDEALDRAPEKQSDAKQNEDTEIVSEESRKVCDMEHITVYELKFYDKREPVKNIPEEKPSQFTLPSITESNRQGRKGSTKKKTKKSKPHRPIPSYKMLGEQTRTSKDYQTFIVGQNCYDNSDTQSISSEAPPLKLPRIENKRLDDSYDPFLSAAKQMKELMSSESNIPKLAQNSSTKDHSRTLPSLQPTKDKVTSHLRSDNTKMMKDTLNKTYQKTPTLQRMKSFGGSNNDNSSSTFGGRCSSFRLNKNEKKPVTKLNTTFTKSSKENISTAEKNFFNRNSNLNRSFSSYSTSCYSTPKPRDKIPKIATSMYHSFQRTTIKQPVKLDKIKKDDTKKDCVNLDSILADDNSSMTDSNYIDPRLINENDNLPINVNTILNNPDIISSMESLLTTENLPAKFESFNTVNQSNNKINNNNNPEPVVTKVNNERNNNVNTLNHTVDDFNTQYDKVMYSLEKSINSKASIRDDDSLCEDFDLEEFMTSFDQEIHKHKTENKRTCSSTARIVKQSDITHSNRESNLNSPSPKLTNGMIPVNKSMSLNFSSNNIVSENLFPSSMKRSTSFLDSVQKKSAIKQESGRTRHKSDQLEEDIMQSLKDFDKFYEAEKNDQSYKETVHYNGTARRDSRAKAERKLKKIETTANGNYTPNGKSSNDSAYSSLNRLSPSKLSLVASKEPNGLKCLEQIPDTTDSIDSPKDARSISSDEFLAMERSAELNEAMLQPDVIHKEPENHINEKRANSSASRRHSGSWRTREASRSSSGSDASLHKPAQRLSRFCHECGNKFPVDTAKFCIQCGVKRLVV